MLPCYLQGFIDTLFNGDRGHHDNELAHPEPLIQLKQGAQIDIGFPRPSFHLDGEIPTDKLIRRGQFISQLHLLGIGQ